MNNRDQAIKDVAEAAGKTVAVIVLRLERPEDKMTGYAVSRQERVLELESAIRWALGYEQADGSDFRERRPGEGAYWWRSELEARAKLAAPEKAHP